MTTDKRRIQVYLSESLFQRVQEYCSHHNIKSQSRAVELLLTDYFSKKRPKTDSNVTADILSRLTKLESQYELLTNTNSCLIDESLADLNDDLPNSSQVTESTELLSELPSELINGSNETDVSPNSSSLSELPSELSLLETMNSLSEGLSELATPETGLNSELYNDLPSELSTEEKDIPVKPQRKSRQKKTPTSESLEG